MDSYRVEVKAKMALQLADEDAEIGPVPTSGGGRKPEAKLDRLSNIIKTFNEPIGNIEWKDADKTGKVISEEIPEKVAADRAYQNAMRNSDKQNARIEHDKALQRVMVDLPADNKNPKGEVKED
jgi:type I restriction enzyme R subunit